MRPTHLHIVPSLLCGERRLEVRSCYHHQQREINTRSASRMSFSLLCVESSIISKSVSLTGALRPPFLECVCVVRVCTERPTSDVVIFFQSVWLEHGRLLDVNLSENPHFLCGVSRFKVKDCENSSNFCANKRITSKWRSQEVKWIGQVKIVISSETRARIFLRQFNVDCLQTKTHLELTISVREKQCLRTNLKQCERTIASRRKYNQNCEKFTWCCCVLWETRDSVCRTASMHATDASEFWIGKALSVRVQRTPFGRSVRGRRRAVQFGFNRSHVGSGALRAQFASEIQWGFAYLANLRSTKRITDCKLQLASRTHSENRIIRPQSYYSETNNRQTHEREKTKRVEGKNKDFLLETSENSAAFRRAKTEIQRGDGSEYLYCWIGVWWPVRCAHSWETQMPFLSCTFHGGNGQGIASACTCVEMEMSKMYRVASGCHQGAHKRDRNSPDTFLFFNAKNRE